MADDDNWKRQLGQQYVGKFDEALPLGWLASQHGRIEFAFATDYSVRLPLLSTSPRDDAVTVGYRPG
jgi:hypothetical protein